MPIQLVKPIQETDREQTIEGLTALLALAKDPSRPAVGVVFAVVWNDSTTDFGRLGLMQRSTEKAFRVANQLADTLLWD